MCKVIVFICLILATSFTADAQFGGLLNKVKSKAKQRVDNKVDSEIDKGLDKAEGKTPPAGTQTTNSEKQESNAEVIEDNTLKSYSRFDFIPGDSILYAEDFQQEALGELPTNWNTNGTGEVTTLDKYPGQWLKLHKQFTYLTANQKKFGDNYTMEFDVILQLKSNGWMYPEFHVGAFSSADESNTANDFLKNYEKNAVVIATLHPAENSSSKTSVKSYLQNKNYYSSESKAYEAMEKFYGKPAHIAIQVQKERFRMWINGDKVFDAPKAVPTDHVMNQLFFEVSHTNYPENLYGVYIGNIKIATGKPDTRHKLIEVGKFSTNGILFDFQSAAIRPESYAVIKEIASVLKEFGNIKVKVVGHTSSDGDDNANMELSKKRAAAVKEMLSTEFGVDGSRIETEGRGETQPVADNKTKEGKTINRRVEFIKL